mmetsp:Transcript_10847/g.24590  ORF Transcript_10847/g.24590 Transcript_10847/m.24590 type:complete len:581 (-) Transcript_10847:151-1893(-)
MLAFSLPAHGVQGGVNHAYKVAEASVRQRAVQSTSQWTPGVTSIVATGLLVHEARRKEHILRSSRRARSFVARSALQQATSLSEVEETLSAGLFDTALLQVGGMDVPTEELPRAKVLEAVARAGMQHYEAAEECLREAEAALSNSPCSDIDIAALRDAISKLSLQSREGQYDFLDVYGESLDLQERQLSSLGLSLLPQLADYAGPVEVFRTADGIRGLRTTRNVLGGEILLCCNPVLVSVDGQEMTARGQKHPFGAVLKDACERSPHIRRVATELLSDGQRPSNMVTTSDFAWKEPISSDAGEVADDIIEGVKQTNCFEDFGKCCMYPLLAMANHSCTPNVNCIPVGDTVMLRAGTVIAAGEEVRLSYFDVLKPYAERQKLTSTSWNFECKCIRCELEKHMPEGLRVRGDDAVELDRLLKEETALPESERAFQWVRAGHTETYKARLESTFPFSPEAAALRQQLLRAVECTTPANFTHTKYALLDWVCTRAKGNQEVAMQAMQYAGLVHRTRYGEIPLEHMAAVVQKTEAALQSEGIGEEFCQKSTRSQRIPSSAPPVRAQEQDVQPLQEKKAGSLLMLD